MKLFFWNKNCLFAWFKRKKIENCVHCGANSVIFNHVSKTKSYNAY